MTKKFFAFSAAVWGTDVNFHSYHTMPRTCIGGTTLPRACFRLHLLISSVVASQLCNPGPTPPPSASWSNHRPGYF